MRNLSGWVKRGIGIWLMLVSLFAVYTAAFGIMLPRIQRGIHLMFLLPMAFILFPANRKRPTDQISIYDWLLAFLSLLPPLYLIVENSDLSKRLEFVDPVSTVEMVLGGMNILLLLEAIRRAVVPAMAFLIGSFFLYLYLAPYLPGVFHAKPLPLTEIIEMQYLLTDTGIYGAITGISATFVALFVIFGAFMESTRTGKFFTDLACRLAGKSIGGPAKVAVISSSLFGSISGVAAANVYATGTFTIPLMKRLGYRPQFAGAVEAVASSGGQYMPPIMGAGAFVMSEITGIPYLQICVGALLSALLYYGSLVMRVHFIAVKDQLSGINDESLLVPYSTIMRDAYLLIPLVGLVAALVMGYSVFMAALVAISLSFVISFFKKETALTPSRLMAALSLAGQNMVIIALACAGAGMVVAVVTHTGLALGIATVITNWSGGYLLPALVLIMVTSLLLGMGMPCTPAYIIAVTVSGPALIAMGVKPQAAHLFVFYFAILAEVTPPVCIPAFCAAAIAQSKPLSTGFEAFKLAVVAFLIPYVFIYNETLLMKGTFTEIVSLVLVLLIGVTLLSGALSGYFFKKLGAAERIVMTLVGGGAIIVGARQELVNHPLTLTLAVSLVLLYILWTVIRRRGQALENSPSP